MKFFDEHSEFLLNLQEFCVKLLAVISVLGLFYWSAIDKYYQEKRKSHRAPVIEDFPILSRLEAVYNIIYDQYHTKNQVKNILNQIEKPVREIIHAHLVQGEVPVGKIIHQVSTISSVFSNQTESYILALRAVIQVLPKKAAELFLTTALMNQLIFIDDIVQTCQFDLSSTQVEPDVFLRNEKEYHKHLQDILSSLNKGHNEQDRLDLAKKFDLKPQEAEGFLSRIDTLSKQINDVYSQKDLKARSRNV